MSSDRLAGLVLDDFGAVGHALAERPVGTPEVPFGAACSCDRVNVRCALLCSEGVREIRQFWRQFSQLVPGEIRVIELTSRLRRSRFAVVWPCALAT